MSAAWSYGQVVGAAPTAPRIPRIPSPIASDVLCTHVDDVDVPPFPHISHLAAAPPGGGLRNQRRAVTASHPMKHQEPWHRPIVCFVGA